MLLGVFEHGVLVVFGVTLLIALYNKDLQKWTRTPIFIAYKIKTNFITKQVVWTFRKFLILQFDSKFASKQQRLAKIGTILWLSLSTQIS